MDHLFIGGVFKAFDRQREEIMKKVLLISFLAAIFSSGLHAEYSVVYVHGQPVSCTASNGQQVLFYDHQGAAMAARQMGGARADFTPQFGYTIALDPDFMNRLPRLGALFAVFHECGHVALPMGVGLASPAQERNADCYAVRTMRQYGILNSWDDFNEAMSAVVTSGGGHAMTQQRINAMAQCVQR